MASSTLLYIAWPLTLGLSFMAGSMILSKESATEKSKVSHRYSPSNDSIDQNSATTNRRSSFRRSQASKNTYAESYDLKEIIDSSDPQIRLTKLVSTIDQLGPADLKLLLADFRERERSLISKMEEQVLIKAWAKINPERALAYAKENKSYVASKTALRTWAEYAPDAAIQWVKLNHEGNKVSTYLVDIIEGISSSDPERATSMLPELMSSDHHQALAAIIPHVHNLGTEKATVWLANIKGEELRAKATNRVVRLLAEKDPQATADWLQTLPAKDLHNNAVILAYSWAKKDSEKAAEWTSSLEGKTRVSAARRMLPHFLHSDPNKAATWLKTMSAEPSYRHLVDTFMSHSQRIAPEVALANLDQISNGYARNLTRKKSLTNWAVKDKNAATQWMQSNNIDTATQKKILSDAASAYPDIDWL